MINNAIAFELYEYLKDKFDGFYYPNDSIIKIRTTMYTNAIIRIRPDELDDLDLLEYTTINELILNQMPLEKLLELKLTLLT
ncbi:MAG: hypothetical protein DRG78_00450 [Epsilonproteobacteria bacterium]|nr:MAG: hypothetical protein DRG78_00450 [Campylobacterota bacterium]